MNLVRRDSRRLPMMVTIKVFDVLVEAYRRNHYYLNFRIPKGNLRCSGVAISEAVVITQ